MEVFGMIGDTSPVATMGSKKSEDHIPAAITDIGCEREINEDRYAVIDSPAGRAWIVCDGMGGALGGELAAQLAIDSMRRALDSRDFEDGADALSSAIDEANRIIVLRRQNPVFSSMGTTVVAALICDDEIFISHAGDSRAYIVRDGEIQQLTVDHTYVQDLVDKGAITAEDALSHPQAHVLTKCLGADPRLELTNSKYWVWGVSGGEPKDKLLLCSDGLYSLVSETEIASAVSTNSPQEACVQLVELAKERGGFDNITLAILPLEGQLHEESAGGGAKAGKKGASRGKRKSTVAPNTRSASLNLPQFSLAQKAFLMVASSALGVLLTSLVMYWKVVSQ
ncbi:hypothetical protein BVY02_00475 [bacterium J17]|nr:hypothetical protein BVY02_00475 [bacterium J17]